MGTICAASEKAEGSLECANCSIADTHKSATDGFYGPSDCLECKTAFYHSGKAAGKRCAECARRLNKCSGCSGPLQDSIPTPVDEPTTPPSPCGGIKEIILK